MRSESFSRFSRRGAGGGRSWTTRAAFLTGAAGAVLAVLVLVSVLGLIGSGEGATGGALDVPVTRIVVVVLLGFLVALALLVLAARSRTAGPAWGTAVIAVLVALAVSVYPLVATANAAVDQASQVLPWITDLITRVLG